MRVFLSILGIVGGFLMIKFRKEVGDNFAEADWMAKLGGMNNVVVLLGVLAVFFGIAAATDTLDFFLAPVLYIIPGGIKPPEPTI
jgi:hypothetical protein